MSQRLRVCTRTPEKICFTSHGKALSALRAWQRRASKEDVMVYLCTTCGFHHHSGHCTQTEDVVPPSKQGKPKQYKRRKPRRGGALIHVAGEVTDGIQSCSRCGQVLIETRGFTRPANLVAISSGVARALTTWSGLEPTCRPAGEVQVLVSEREGVPAEVIPCPPYCASNMGQPCNCT